MENIPGTGRHLPAADLVALLRDAANEIERGASYEGSVAWETPDHFDGRYEVLAFYRTGTDMGQGGCVLVRGDIG